MPPTKDPANPLAALPPDYQQAILHSFGVGLHQELRRVLDLLTTDAEARAAWLASQEPEEAARSAA